MIEHDMHSILIIEDNISLAKLLEDTLASKGYKTKVAHLKSTAVKLMTKMKFDLVLLDRLLPDGDGLELLSKLQEISFHTKTLVLSIKGDTDDKVIGLEKGADDYLPKPFSYAELVLRVRGLLTKQKVLPLTTLTAGKLYFYPESGQVMVGSREYQFRPQESAIIHCLLAHKNQVVTRAMLVRWVWHDSEPAASTIDVYMRRIRSILGDDATLIETIRGFGFRVRSLHPGVESH